MKNSMEKTKWMHERTYGVFLHHLFGQINNPDHPKSMGKCTSWDEALKEFDFDYFAAQLNEVGAGWCFVTIMQQSKYMIAPNATYDKITGYKPGEACATFDFIEEMYKALSKYDIALMLYFTGDGPTKDEQAQKAFGCWDEDEKILRESFVKKWADVAREYSLRYGEKVKGWWQDGMWIGSQPVWIRNQNGYTPELLKYYSDAFRAGNPDAVVATNFFGCLDHYGVLVKEPRNGCEFDDYTAGEQVDFGAVPYCASVGDCRWHALSFLGKPPEDFAPGGWGKPGTKYTPGWMYDYLDKVHKIGGIITIDICAYRNGHIDEEQMKVLRPLKHI